MAFAQGDLTALALVEYYQNRIEHIDQHGATLNSVIELNPQAEEIAMALDAERAIHGPRGPLHGIPVLLKDNLDTADSMLTTAGSLALIDSSPLEDAFVVQRLRQAGAVILGKTNLSEWANFRSLQSSSGWSGRGGQTRNPYRLDHTPGGSSSGSGVAVAANLTAVAIGTETDGSIVCPSAANGIVGLKPTVGLTSRHGVIPLAHSQDTVGPMTRTVTDAALVLGAMVGVDANDPTTAQSAGRFSADYSQFLDLDGLRGARLGVAREVYFGYQPEVDALIEQAIDLMRAHGAIIIDPADIPTARAIEQKQNKWEVMFYEFKTDIAAYLNRRRPHQPEGTIPRTLADLIDFNHIHAAQEMPYFGQEIFEISQRRGSLSDPFYQHILASNRRMAGAEGIDAALAQHQLSALIVPTQGTAWPIDWLNGDTIVGGCSTPAAMAGYPLITVPAGFVDGLPVGLTFMGSAYSEPTLLKLAYSFEQASLHRQPPHLS